MAAFAVGDVQGCYDALQALLAKIDFKPERDRLWFVGDLVNRGPRSADVVRLAMRLPSCVCVLGNHDLHLLAVASGKAQLRPKDTFHDLLAAPDRDAMLEWLRNRPLLHHDAELGYTLVHAGLLPAWNLAMAQSLAAEAEAAIRCSADGELFTHMYGDVPVVWDDALRGWERLRMIINVFTRLRFCAPDGRMDLQSKGPPGSQPPGMLPWFAVPGRKNRALRIVFGHWSTLGLKHGDGVLGLDSGCLWGRRLSAALLAASPVITSVPCVQQQAPGQHADRPRKPGAAPSV